MKTSDNETERHLDEVILNRVDPISAFWANPCSKTLADICKDEQTLEMVNRALEYETYGSSPILKNIARRFFTQDLCFAACQKNCNNLKYVPKQFRSDALYEIAIESHGELLSEVPLECRSPKLCELAIKNDKCGYALQYVPFELLNSNFIYDAVLHAPTKQDFSILLPDGSHFSFSKEVSFWPISYVPKQYLTSELIKLSIEHCPSSLQVIPPKFLTESQCLQLINKNPSWYRYLPTTYKARKAIIDAALQLMPTALRWVPENKRTKARCIQAHKQDPSLPSELFPESFRSEFSPAASLPTVAAPCLCCPPVLTNHYSSFSPDSLSTPLVHNTVPLSIDESRKIYYISDIHLENQLPLDGKNTDEIRDCIRSKVQELACSLDDSSGIILIAGDISYSVPLEHIFYSALNEVLQEHSNSFPGWKVISILGNHELWDGKPYGSSTNRQIDEIIQDYRYNVPVTILENELYLSYKGLKNLRISESDILNRDVDSLTELLKHCSFILLAGIGFSGLNPVFNASSGLYRNTVNASEDVLRSNRFCAIYRKILQAASTQLVIVMTHTPMSDWSNEPYNRRWIYLSGHTHQNTFVHKEDGSTLLADNQIGYAPKKWHFNAFTIRKYYNPFEGWTDGIYPITPTQYIDFTLSRGISISTPFKHTGKLFLVKRGDAYLFLLENKRLYILEGGHLHSAEHNISYYFNHLAQYQCSVQKAFAPYQNALKSIAAEVKLFGGRGSVHGCIIDIDFFNHLYLNPYDGTLTPYFASDITNKLVYENLPDLLSNSPCPPKLQNGEPLSNAYQSALDSNLLPILSEQAVSPSRAIATIPQLVLDHQIYEPSRAMRSIQYVFEQNVVRTWNDKILNLSTEPSHLTE